jgi:ribonuclease P protein component
MMLDRDHRLTSGRDFADTIRRGRRVGTPTVVLHLAPAPDKAPDRALDGAPDRALDHARPRIGFVVGKTVGNAVVRNRVKRRLRHLLRERIAALPGGAALVVRALPAAAAATTVTLTNDVDRALDRLRGPVTGRLRDEAHR